METSLPRVLSIQSSVTHGYVGNKASTFAIQSFGQDIDPINTVQFSNHTGYPSFKGSISSASQIQEIFNGLEENGLDQYGFLLTGYIRGMDALRVVLDIHQKLKKKNQDLIWVCDPVMGDGGKLYVPPELVSVYVKEVIPNADIILPNQTEAEFLTNAKINTLQDSFQVCEQLHSMGPKTIIITSLDLEKPNFIVCIISEKKNPQQKALKFTCKIPSLDAYFSGTGDLFAATVVAWISKGVSIEKAVENTLNSIRQILLVTYEAKSKELKLIQNREALLNPLSQLKVEPYLE